MRPECLESFSVTSSRETSQGQIKRLKIIFNQDEQKIFLSLFLFKMIVFVGFFIRCNLLC